MEQNSLFINIIDRCDDRIARQTNSLEFLARYPKRSLQVQRACPSVEDQERQGLSDLQDATPETSGFRTNQEGGSERDAASSFNPSGCGGHTPADETGIWLREVEETQEEIFIAPNLIGSASDGDVVEGLIVRRKPEEEEGIEEGGGDCRELIEPIPHNSDRNLWSGAEDSLSCPTTTGRKRCLCCQR